MMNKREAYEANVDTILTLMNKAKKFGYKMEFYEVAKMVGIDLNNLQFYNAMDLMLIASVNDTYAQNEQAFKKVVVAYNNRIGANV